MHPLGVRRTAGQRNRCVDPAGQDLDRIIVCGDSECEHFDREGLVIHNINCKNRNESIRQAPHKLSSTVGAIIL